MSLTFYKRWKGCLKEWLKILDLKSISILEIAIHRHTRSHDLARHVERVEMGNISHPIATHAKVTVTDASGLL